MRSPSSLNKIQGSRVLAKKKKILADRKKWDFSKSELRTFHKIKHKIYIDSFVCGASYFAIFLIQMENYVAVHEIHLDNQLPVLQWNFRVYSHYYGEHMWLQMNEILLLGPGRCWTRLDSVYLPAGEERTHITGKMPVIFIF